MLGTRIRTIHDFGYVALEFVHVHPEDSGSAAFFVHFNRSSVFSLGIYTCRASNAFGEAITEFEIECRRKYFVAISRE